MFPLHTAESSEYPWRSKESNGWIRLVREGRRVSKMTRNCWKQTSCWLWDNTLALKNMGLLGETLKVTQVTSFFSGFSRNRRPGGPADVSMLRLPCCLYMWCACVCCRWANLSGPSGGSWTRLSTWCLCSFWTVISQAGNTFTVVSHAC